MNGGVHCCKVAMIICAKRHCAHTPMLLTTLTESQDRSLAINNPQLAADVKTVWLKEEPSLLLFVDQPALSQLRDLVKTGATRKIRSEARHRLEEKQ
jgi:hypothetical protein